MLKLSAPWCTYYKMISCLFAEDPEVDVRFHEDLSTIVVLVKNVRKADALTQLLPNEKTFGNVTVNISIETIRTEKDKATEFTSLEDILTTAFDKNTAVSDIKFVEDIFGGNWAYVMFKPVVIQFFNDDITHPNGCMTTIYQDMAREVFISSYGVFCCTDEDTTDKEK